MRKANSILQSYALIFTLTFGLASGPAYAAEALVEQFESTVQFTTNTPFFSDGFSDYLGITDGSGGGDFGGGASPSGIKAYTGFDGNYLVGMDLDGEGASLPVILEWSDINIQGLTNLALSADLAEFFDTPGDIDATDFVTLEVSIDGGAFEPILSFRLDELEPDDFNGVFSEDTDFDGRGDGLSLGDIAQTFNRPISGTGASLTLRLSLNVNAGDEDIAVDRIIVSGDGDGTPPDDSGSPLVERFDDASQFTSSNGFFSDGGFDYLGIANGLGGGDFGGNAAPTGLKGYIGFEGNFLAGMDLDGEGATLPIVLEWADINVSGLTEITFSGDFAEFFDAPGDIDASDFVDVAASLDGGPYNTILSFRLDELEPDDFNGLFSEDTDFDGRGDGVTLGNSPQTFTSVIPGTGDTLNLRISLQVNAGDEDIAIDNILIFEGDGGEPPPPPAAAVVINEVLADPAADLSGDANGDGTRDGSEDEFIELVNPSENAIDLSGWSITDAVATRHVFPAGSTLQPNCSLLVFGGGSPTGDFGGAVVQTASAGFLGFNNSGDTITLVDDAGQEVDMFGYGSEGGSDQSLTRNPDITGSFVQHLTATDGVRQSPGTQVTGDAFADCPSIVPEVRIHEVQGAGASSPLSGQSVRVEGIVTAALSGLSGFYVQEQDDETDADPATSEGVFVFYPAGGVSVGDQVRVTGTAGEFFEQTQISNVSDLETLSSGNPLPSVANVTLPVDTVDSLEAFEGMRLILSQTLVVTETFNLARFGEFDLATERLYNPTHIAAPGAAAAAVGELNDRSRIKVDDGSTAQNPDPTFHPAGGLSANNTVRLGDTLTGLEGVLSFSFGSYRVIPESGAVFNPTNPRPPSPDDPGGRLKVATANLLNYFVTLDESGNGCGPAQNLGCRGADSSFEFDRQSAKTIAAINALNADIVGLVEIENSPADVLPTLVADLNSAAGDDIWDYIDTGPIGQDAIRVGLIYKPKVVKPSGPFAILTDSSVIPSRNRVPLAQTFTEKASGECFTVVVNHFKSKGSACDTANAPGELVDPDTGDGQGNCNLTRTAAAQAVANWIATDPTGQGDPDYLILGDLNAYAQEDPIQALKSAGYTDLTDSFLGAEAYSFVFGGESGYLDYAMSSESLTPQVIGLSEWHINADEVRALDYNEEFKSPGQVESFYAPDPYRSSDHDPLVVGIDLESKAELEAIDSLKGRTFFRWAALRWKPMAGATSYNLYRRTETTENTLRASGIRARRGFYIDRVVPGVKYIYTIEWVDENGNVSPLSNEATVISSGSFF